MIFGGHWRSIPGVRPRAIGTRASHVDHDSRFVDCRERRRQRHAYTGSASSHTRLFTAQTQLSREFSARRRVIRAVRHGDDARSGNDVGVSPTNEFNEQISPGRGHRSRSAASPRFRSSRAARRTTCYLRGGDQRADRPSKRLATAKLLRGNVRDELSATAKRNPPASGLSLRACSSIALPALVTGRLNSFRRALPGMLHVRSCAPVGCSRS